MARYGKKAADKIAQVMRERKQGTLRSGGSGTKVTSRKQAIAIALSEARRAGGKVPPEKSRRTRSGSASDAPKSSVRRRGAGSAKRVRGRSS